MRSSLSADHLSHQAGAARQHHIIDYDVARFFYQIIQYYPGFESALSRNSEAILQRIQELSEANAKQANHSPRGDNALRLAKRYRLGQKKNVELHKKKLTDSENRIRFSRKQLMAHR